MAAHREPTEQMALTIGQKRAEAQGKGLIGKIMEATMALEEKVIASWKYKKGALDPKTAYLCYLAANLAVGNTH